MKIQAKQYQEDTQIIKTRLKGKGQAHMLSKFQGKKMT